MTISHELIQAVRPNWPHHPTSPTPTVTLTARQAQQILRSLVSGFASVVELEWIATQLGPDHIAHPLEQRHTIRSIIDAINNQAAQDQDHYKRGYHQGRQAGETIARDATWAEGYHTGYKHAQAGAKPHPYPPDDNQQIAAL